MSERRPMTPGEPGMKRNASLRKRVREISGGFCAKCGTYDAKGEADHIVALWCDGKDRVENMQWLCRHCHIRKSVKETPIRAKADRLKARADLTKRRKPVAPSTPENAR